jgi:ribosome-associated protein
LTVPISFGRQKMEIVIHTEYIKLDQLMKLCGLAETGGRAKEIIQEGYVKVNSSVCYERGKKICDGDIIQYENKTVKVKGETCEDNKA